MAYITKPFVPDSPCSNCRGVHEDNVNTWNIKLMYYELVTEILNCVPRLIKQYNKFPIPGLIDIKQFGKSIL